MPQLCCQTQGAGTVWKFGWEHLALRLSSWHWGSPAFPMFAGFNLQATNPHTTATARFPSHVRNMYVTHRTATVIPPATSHPSVCMVFGPGCSQSPASSLSSPSMAVQSYTSPRRCSHPFPPLCTWDSLICLIQCLPDVSWVQSCKKKPTLKNNLKLFL